MKLVRSVASETTDMPEGMLERALLTSRENGLMSNIEAEAALLGALMRDNSLIGAMTHLESESFFEPVHGRIFAAISRLTAEGHLATPITLKPLFDNDPAIIQLGGPAYLAQLTGSGAGLIGAKDFARQIDDLYRRRQFFYALIDSAKACLSDWSETEIRPIVTQLDDAVAATVTVAEERASSTLARTWDGAMQRYDAIEAGTIEPGIQVDGLDDFNELLDGGMRPGQLIVIAGRPGMGKTAFAVTLASSCARANIPTAFFSLEMPNEELIERQITDICFQYGQSFTYAQLKRGKVPAFHRKRINQVREEIADWPLIYDDTAEMKVGHLIGKLRRLKSRMEKKGQPLKVAIVDYLQLLKHDKDTGNDVADLTRTTRSLKVAAKALGITIILLSQLNRGVEQRDDKRPRLDDLRGSGSIEQDADAVMFLYREEYYLELSKPDDLKRLAIWQESYDASRDRLELIAAKVRGAAKGARKCYFFGAHQAVRGSRFLVEGGY